MNFDVIVGNPPYQENDDGFGSSATPLYHKFIKWSFKNSDKTILVTPSRWFIGGKGLGEFRKWMLDRNDIVSIRHYDNNESPFETVDLPGGVNWFFRDQDYCGKPKLNENEVDTKKYDILVKNSKIYPIIDKVRAKSEKFLSDIYVSNSYYNVKTNDERLEKNPKNDSYIKCFVSDEKGLEKWIHKGHVENKKKFWKVVTSESYGEYPTFGPKHLSPPNTIFSQSYIAFHVFSKKEAKNLITYLQSDFANFFLDIRKNTQHISKKTVKWVPLPPLEKRWGSEDLFDYYDFTKEDINIVKNLL